LSSGAKGGIAGGVVGGLVLLGVAIGAFLYCRQGRNPRTETTNSDFENPPATIHTPGMKEVSENVQSDYEKATAIRYPTLEQPENTEMSSGRLNSGEY